MLVSTMRFLVTFTVRESALLSEIADISSIAQNSSERVKI